MGSVRNVNVSIEIVDRYNIIVLRCTAVLYFTYVLLRIRFRKCIGSCWPVHDAEECEKRSSDMIYTLYSNSTGA